MLWLLLYIIQPLASSVFLFYQSPSRTASCNRSMVTDTPFFSKLVCYSSQLPGHHQELVLQSLNLPGQISMLHNFSPLLVLDHCEFRKVQQAFFTYTATRSGLDTGMDNTTLLYIRSLLQKIFN